MPSKIIIALAAAATFAATVAEARSDQTNSSADAIYPAPYGPDITAEQAQKVLSGAEAEAVRKGWKVAIAIVEPSGDLVIFKKMTGTLYKAVDAAMGKARTSAEFQRPTSVFAKLFAEGRIDPSTMPSVRGTEGGIPIIVDGRTIGAIGVSGAATSQMDDEVAKAAVTTMR